MSLTQTQRAILLNVRDHGDSTGDHGAPYGRAQTGGWEGSVRSLFRRGVITYMGGRLELTDAGRELLEENR